jgi:hypothetical protein
MLLFIVTYPEDTVGAVGEEADVAVELLQVQVDVWQYGEWRRLLRNLPMKTVRRIEAIS